MGIYLIHQVLCVILGKIFHAKAINTKDKGCFTASVFPEFWGVLHWVISKECIFLNELFECNDAGFFEVVNSLADFEVDVPVGFDGELVFIHDFIGYECVVDMEVLIVLHWDAEVEVLEMSM